MSYATAVTLLALTTALPGARPAEAPSIDAGDAPVPLRLIDAVEIALVRSYRLRQAKLDLEEAKKETKASYSSVWPRLDASAGYTRNIVVPNPFAGSGAGDVFGGLGAIGWLEHNERARTDPASGRSVVSFDEYSSMNEAGLLAAGYDPDSASSNPFFVPNNFNLGLSLSQLLYDGAAFSGIEAAEKYVDTVDAAVKVESLQVVSDTARAFYGALLAREQTKILTKSVERTRATVEETKQRVARGVQPKFAQLSAEVELANLETQLLRAENQAEAAIDGLKATLGLPPARQVELRGDLTLTEEAAPLPGLEVALEQAMANRPDVQQARLGVQLLELQEDVTFAQFMPVLKAVANLGLQGSVPDNRTNYVGTGQPFTYQEQNNAFFSSNYWFGSFNVGLSMTWNIFNGFKTAATLEQNEVATNRARLQLQQLEDNVRIQVEQARRDLSTAQEQIATQARNIERAELNYRHAELRVKEGVSTQLELREASTQLDQSQFAHRQAVHDYLVARTSYDVALGTPPVALEESP